jgi:hypothetical protein
MHCRLPSPVAAPLEMLTRRSLVGCCLLLAAFVFVSACGKQQENTSVVGGPPPESGHSETAQKAPAPPPPPTEPPLVSLGSTVEIVGLRQGIAVLTKPEGQAEQRSEVKSIAVTCYAATPSDLVPTVRRWDTVLKIEEPGKYRFRLMTDDDGALTIAGTKLMTTTTLNPALAAVDFKRAGGYRLTLEVMNNIGPYCADLLWAKGSSDDFVQVPPDRYYLPR